jgi:PAS domain S-box-containing protein
MSNEKEIIKAIIKQILIVFFVEYSIMLVLQQLHLEENLNNFIDATSLAIFSGILIYLFVSRPTIKKASHDLYRQMLEREKLEYYSQQVEGLNKTSNVVVTDVAGIIKYANNNFFNLTGYSPEEIIGKNLRFLNSGYHLKECISNFWNTIQSGQIWRGEFKNKRKDGQFFWVDMIVIPILDDDKNVIEYVSMIFDITEKKENALLFKELVETSPLGFWLADGRGNLLEVNEAYAKMSGYTINELSAITITELDATESPKETAERIEKIIASGGGSFETQHRRKNGSVFDVEITVSYNPIKHGVMCVFIRDISDQKNREKEQRILVDLGSILSSTLDYENTLDNILNLTTRELADFCSIYIVDEKGEMKRLKTISRNAGHARICDLFMSIPFEKKHKNPVSLAVESNQTQYLGKLTSIDLESIAQNKDHLNALLAADINSIVVVPLQIHGKLIGALKLMAQTTSPSFEMTNLRLIEEIGRLAAIAIDNAQLYREARQAKLIADNVPAMMAYWDNEQRCLFANSAYIDWFGFEPKNLIGHTMLDIMGPTIYEKTLPYIIGALKGEHQSFVRDLKNRSSNKIRHTQALYLPDKLNDRVMGFFALVFDVTELKEAQLNAIAAVKAREDILSVVAHDLKNPLSSILLSTQNLKNRPQIDQHLVNEHTKYIQRAVGQMQRLIGDLLDFGKIESGTLIVDKFREKPEEVIFPIVEIIRPLAEARHQTFEVKISSTLSDVACDSFRIGQVLSNLLGNAIKFTPEGGTIRLLVTQMKDELVVSISDTGPGIPEEHLQKVFERFWQAEKTKQIGSGLGLAITKGIIKAHGAKIWVESRVGFGSCFSFTIPLATNELKKNDLSSELLPNASLNANRHLIYGINIMVVDDSADNLILMKQILQKVGAKFIGAESVKEAITNVLKERPDLIVTDIEMPDEDGYDLIAKVRKITQKDQFHIPVVALTAHSDEKELQKITDAGFDACFSKPIKIDKIISSIEKLVLHDRKKDDI